MRRHVHVHFHDEQGRDPDGKFAAGGSGHAPKGHPTAERAQADVAERRKGLEGSGFKYERNEPAVNGTNHHLAHPDGSRAVISHTQDPVTSRHSVNSYVNTTNQGKKPVGANAHKLLDPGFVANMHPGQKKLSGIK